MELQLNNRKALDYFYTFYRKVFEYHPQRVEMIGMLEDNMKSFEMECMRDDAAEAPTHSKNR